MIVVGLSLDPVLPAVWSIGPDVCPSWLMADVTVADDDANPIPTNEAGRAVSGNMAMPVAPPGGQICNQWDKLSYGFSILDLLRVVKHKNWPQSELLFLNFKSPYKVECCQWPVSTNFGLQTKNAFFETLWLCKCEYRINQCLLEQSRDMDEEKEGHNHGGVYLKLQ